MITSNYQTATETKDMQFLVCGYVRVYGLEISDKHKTTFLEHTFSSPT
jgi:hypothetical protein